MRHTFTHEECVLGGKQAQRLYPELKEKGLNNLRRLHNNSIVQRRRRYHQMALEQTTVQDLQEEGWEVISPTVVCDRIGIKDGRVFLLEFKKQGQELTENQKKIQKLIPRMYKVITYS